MSVIADSSLLPQLVDRVAELQAQVASARQERAKAEHHMSDHQVQLETLQQLHAQCQEEAEKLRAVLESKEEELSRMLTTLQVASAQVCASIHSFYSLNSHVLRLLSSLGVALEHGYSES